MYWSENKIIIWPFFNLHRLVVKIDFVTVAVLWIEIGFDVGRRLPKNNLASNEKHHFF